MCTVNGFQMVASMSNFDWDTHTKWKELFHLNTFHCKCMPYVTFFLFLFHPTGGNRHFERCVYQYTLHVCAYYILPQNAEELSNSESASRAVGKCRVSIVGGSGSWKSVAVRGMRRSCGNFLYSRRTRWSVRNRQETSSPNRVKCRTIRYCSSRILVFASQV